jgi:hypothetical protein
VRSPVFFSYPKPWAPEQMTFIDAVSEYLKVRGFEPRTLGVTDYDMDAPLRAIRRLMLESNGIVTVALRRIHIASGIAKRLNEDGRLEDSVVDDRWLSTPWAHIELAMAYQLGLPILIFRERGVIADGVLEPGIVGVYVPAVDLTQDIETYFSSPEWTQPIGQWEGRVRRVIERKGLPPELY